MADTPHLFAKLRSFLMEADLVQLAERKTQVIRQLADVLNVVDDASTKLITSFDTVRSLTKSSDALKAAKAATKVIEKRSQP